MKDLLSNRLRFVSVALIMLGLLKPAMAGDFPNVVFAPDSNGGIQFTMPSGNIECYYVPAQGTRVYRPQNGTAELRCDRAQPLYLSFNLQRGKAATIIKNPGEQSCCGDANVLPYGSSWSKPPFLCESTASGLNCETDDGHGFSISRASTKAY